MMLSLFMFMDSFLMWILFLKTSKKNLFYFMSLVIYYNMILWMSLPIYMMKEFYMSMWLFMKNPMNLSSFLLLKFNFLMTTMLFVLLLDMEWIIMFITFFMLNELCSIYINFWMDWKHKKVNSMLDWKENCMALSLASNNMVALYYYYMEHLSEAYEFSYEVILMFNGILNEKDFIMSSNFSFFNWSYDIYGNFLNNYYKKYKKMSNIMWSYYDSKSDEEFILCFLYEFIMQNDVKKLEFREIIDKNSMNEMLNDKINVKFYKEIYFMIFKFLVMIKINNDLFDEFFYLSDKYNLSFIINSLEEIDMKEFFSKINLKKM